MSDKPTLNILYVSTSVAANTAMYFEKSDDTTAWWMKAGIKKAFNSLGDTSFAFQYGEYKDQYGTGHRTEKDIIVVGNPGITGSKVKRMGFEVNQYFGSRLIIYGTL